MKTTITTKNKQQKENNQHSIKDKVEIDKFSPNSCTNLITNTIIFQKINYQLREVIRIKLKSIKVKRSFNDITINQEMNKCETIIQ